MSSDTSHGQRGQAGVMSAPAAEAVDATAEAILQLSGLTRQLGTLALPEGTCDTAPEIVEAMCEALAVPLVFTAPASDRTKDFAIVALAAEIQREQRAPALSEISLSVAAERAHQRLQTERRTVREHRLPRPDTTRLTVVETGPTDAPAIVISLPCMLSYRLALPWLAALGHRYRCVVLQGRGSGEPIENAEDFDDRGYDMQAQAGDLVAVAEELGDAPVHVMGICGGAAVALAAAADRPDVIGSLSLWHPDLELGDEVERTDHQINLRALVDLGAQSRETGSWIRDKVVSGPMTGVPEGIGPLVVSPYASAELFYRYASLTAATMSWDGRGAAKQLRGPLLVVTSEDDNLAHPAASHRMAQLVDGAQELTARRGSHLDAFRAIPAHVDRLVTFLAD